MSDGSYSYSGSYAGDYSYSYSYSDSSSEKTAEKSPAPSKVAAAAARSRNAAAPPPAVSSRPAAAASPDSGDSYSYSYSYSTTGSDRSPAPGVRGAKGAALPPVPPVPRPTPAAAAAAPKPAAAAPPKAAQRAPAADAESYSYSYSDDGSYSYSYSDSLTETNLPAARRDPPPPGAASRGAAPSAAPAPAAVAPTTAQRGRANSDSYSYSYSQSDEEGTYYYSDGSNYYHDSGDSYSYTGDNSYSYSYSASDRGPGQRRAAGSSASGSGYSDDYYYSSAYSDGSDSYYYSGDSYYASDDHSYSDRQDYDSYSYSSCTDSEGHHRHATNGGRHRQRADSGSGSSYTYSASGKSPSSTTSSYGYSTSAVSVMSETATAVERDVTILRAPAKDAPRPPPAPKRCFVVPKSVEDGVWAFLQRLMAQQQAYEARRAASATAAAAPVSFVQHTTTTAPAAAAEGGAEAAQDGAATNRKKSNLKVRFSLSKKQKKAAAAGRDAATKKEAEEVVAQEDEEAQDMPFITTKDGCFSERSVRIAFGVLRLNHLERREALKSAPVPVPMDTMFDIFNTCVAARAKERVAQAFLAHDSYRRGEVSIAELSTLLRRLGLGTSPVMDGYRISIGLAADGAPEMVMHVEHLVRPEAPPAEAQGEEGAAAAAAPPAPGPLQWEVTPVYVSRIIRRSAANKESTPVRWEHNTLFMGRHAIIRDVGTEALFQRLKTYVEAATYLCVLANVYAIDDTEKATVTVQYPQFIRSVLLAEPPASRHRSSAAAAAPPRKLLFIESLFHTVFRPMEVLQAHDAGRPVPRYNRTWALESTLFSTNDTEEKRRRNVVPGISSDNVRIIPAPPTRPDGEVQLAFVVQKVRVPARPPAHARCFCLVSAVTPGNVFLPAIEVPVCSVVASSKSAGDYTWIFHDKKHKKHAAALRFAGPAEDRIYVECCYETPDDVPPLEAGDGDDAAKSGGTTVWCAGYTVFAVDGAKSAVLPVHVGSLLQPEPTSAVSAQQPSSSTPTAGDTGAAKEGKRRTGPLRWLAKLSSVAHRAKKNVEQTAHNIKIEILRPSKEAIGGAEQLPARYIAFERHLAMIAMLRGAVELVAKEATYALQAFRQQAVRFIFAVAADHVLLDQLCTLWAYRERHWSKAERKDDAQKQQALLASVAALYALNNSCSGSKHDFAKSLQKGKTSHIAIDPAAPMMPIRV